MSLKLKLSTLGIFVFLIITSSLRAQVVEHAKEIVATLCDEKMKGRGYVENGEHLAAAYIRQQFSKSGLKKFGKTYEQKFTTAVNTFPASMNLIIDGITLKAGQDFLIDPASPGISGKFSAMNLTADQLLQDDVWINDVKFSTDKIIVIQSWKKDAYTKEQIKRIQEVTAFIQYSSDNQSKGVIILSDDKLTWSTSNIMNKKPSFVVKASALNDVVREVEVHAENKFIKKYETQNIVGYIEGDREDSLLIFTAHYDHLGMMGKKTIFPGANDNASGVSFLLSLMNHYSEFKPKYTTVFIAFGGEEIGLLGSSYFTQHPLFPLPKIKFLINFDMAGTGDDGIQIVNSKIYQKQFDLITQLNKEMNLLAQVKIRGEACNSDHCLFYKKGVPCFFIYTLGGIQAYHDIYDRSETLPFTDFEDYFKLMTEFISRL